MGGNQLLPHVSSGNLSQTFQKKPKTLAQLEPNEQVENYSTGPYSPDLSCHRNANLTCVTLCAADGSVFQVISHLSVFHHFFKQAFQCNPLMGAVKSHSFLCSFPLSVSLILKACVSTGQISPLHFLTIASSGQRVPDQGQGSLWESQHLDNEKAAALWQKGLYKRD